MRVGRQDLCWVMADRKELNMWRGKERAPWAELEDLKMHTGGNEHSSWLALKQVFVDLGVLRNKLDK